MNVVLDDASEIYVKTGKPRRALGEFCSRVLEGRLVGEAEGTGWASWTMLRACFVIKRWWRNVTCLSPLFPLYHRVIVEILLSGFQSLTMPYHSGRMMLKGDNITAIQPVNV